MKKQSQNQIRFGISARMSFAIGVACILIAVISFGIARHLNKVMTVAAVLDKNWAMAYEIVRETGEAEMADLIIRQREIYEGLSEEERADPTAAGYQALYDVQSNPAYTTIRQKFDQSAHIPHVMWADLRFKDEKTGRYVYLMHTGQKKDGTYGIGYWEEDDDRINSTVITESGDSGEEEPMRILPQWVGTLANKLPRSISYVPYIIDHLWYIHSRHVSNRFSVLYPIRQSSTGETVGYLGIGEYYSNYHSYNGAFIIVFLSVFVPYFIIVAFLAKLYGDWTIVKPIEQLAQAAVDYGTEEDKEQNNDHFRNVKIRQYDEVYLLRDSMADMEDSLTEYIEKNKEMTAKQERIKTEMEMSAQIQLGMLPQALEDNGRQRDFTICASIRPAKEVGGDFYDFFEIDDERIGIVMADVSGKGMPAALFMMMAKTILGNEARKGTSVVDVMRRANRQLCENNPEMLFVTIWFGVYQVKDRIIRYVNAGHDYPALYRHSEGTFSLAEAESSIVMGFDPDTEFTEQKLVLEPKDKLFLYTDGIPEAHNPEGELYDDDRMLAALNRCSDYTQEAFLEAFDAEVRGFIAEAEQFDDMTMLLLEMA